LRLRFFFLPVPISWSRELSRRLMVWYTSKGLKAEVQIYRDNWGVPHIYAENEDYPLGTKVAVGLHVNSNSFGSNNWVVDGAKSVLGKPLVANNPHLAVIMPSIWYGTGLHGVGFVWCGSLLLIYPYTPRSL